MNANFLGSRVEVGEGHSVVVIEIDVLVCVTVYSTVLV